MTFDDEKYRSLRNTLKKAPRLKAKSDFEARLFERIREAENAPMKTEAFKHHPQVVKLAEPKRGIMEILAGLFKPAFAPALGLTVILLVAVVVYFGYFNKLNDTASEQEMSYNLPEDLIIYVKGDVDSFNSNYPKEYSAVTDGELTSSDDSRTYAPGNTPSDHSAPVEFFESPTPIAPAVEKESPRLDKVSEEQRFEMEKGYEMKKGVDSKMERKSDDGILKKESKLSPKKENKTETESPFNIRDQKSNQTITNDADDESDVINQQVEPNISNEQKQDTGNKEKAPNSGRISRAIKDSTKTKSESEKNMNEPAEQK